MNCGFLQEMKPFGLSSEMLILLAVGFFLNKKKKKTSLYSENSSLQFFFLRGFSGCFGICVSLG